MTRRHRPLARLGVFALLASFVPGVSAQVNEEATRAIAAMRTAASAPLSVVRSKRTQLATFISAPGGSIPVPEGSASTREARALSFVQTYGRAFGLRGRADVSVSRAETDALGIDHVRLRQVRSGIPVTGGELVVHLRGNRVIAANGKTLDQIDALTLQPAVSSFNAAGAARNLLNRRLNVTDADLSEPRLEIFNQPLLGGRDFPTRLAWFIEATGPALREFIWVDARGGMVLLHFSQLTEAKNRAIYTASNTSTLSGTLIRSEGAGPTGDTDADLAYNFSGDTYDYFFINHGRDSFDGAGAQLRSLVHYCDPDSCPNNYPNAFWNGTQMVYGNGYSSADDVVAHELTHAVTERSANLFYYMQSGALNESFSDIFGETVDLLNGAGNDAGAVRWQLGEDLSAGAIRSMSNPNLFNDPGKMSDSQFRCDIDPVDQDAGGVHTNSGVPNRAYALMVDGGTYNTITVTGIGLAKAGKIQYRALTQYLTSASDFLDNYNALQQACTDLVGTAGITAGDCNEVGKALNAVQMANPWPCSASYGFNATPPALCPAGKGPSTVFFDNFESGVGNWSISGTPGTWFRAGDPANPLGGTAFATSGVESLWGYNQGITADSRVALAFNLSIPTGAFLQFNHSYGFENDSFTNWDGGVVEYSIDGGATWAPLWPFWHGGANNGGTISTAYMNPLGGMPAFVKDSFGYTASKYDLTAGPAGNLSGQTQVRFRFRIGSDSIIDDYGWFIDDFRIYTCAQNAPVVTTTAATAVTQTTATLNGTVNPNGADTTAVFQYGVTLAYGNQVTAPSPWPGLAAVPMSAAISGLSCNTTYHARAVATNSGGSTYGNDVAFVTSPCPTPPTLASPTFSSVTATSVELAGNVTSDGGSPITERGFVFSASGTNPNPMIGGAGVTKSPVGGTIGTFSTLLSSLSNLTSYSFKAYAINGVGTSYSVAVMFTTLGPPTLGVATSANVSTTSADLGGNVTADGGVPITERGFVFSATTTNSDPIIGGLGVTKAPVGGTTGPMLTPATPLTASTSYSFKAFATNSVGTTYSSVLTFTTSDPPAPEALLARTLAIDSASRANLSNALPQIWYRVRLFANRSYQISAWPVDHEQGVDAAALLVSLFSDDAGIVQANGVTGGSGTLEATPNQPGDGKPFTAVIRPTTTGVYKIRVKVASGGSSTASVNLLLRETTLFSPWTSRAAGFEGFIEMHNNTNAPISVTLRGFDVSGALQGAGLTVTLPPNATDFRTANQIGVPVNVFAGIVLTHEGGFGAVSANITTLNGANGLSFDSPFTSRGREIHLRPLR